MRHKTRCPKVRTVHRSFFDRLILPRVEQYAINHDVHDLDATVNYLRTNYREYRRHKEDPFRKIVLRAIQTLQHNSNHQKRKCNSLHEEEEEEEEEDEEEEEASSSRESDSNGSQFELNPTSFPGLMNTVLRTNYGANVNASPPKPSESTKSTQENTKMDINNELCSENGNELDGIVSNSKERQESQGGLEVKLKKEDKGFDSRVMFKDLGGLSGVINEVMEIIYPLFHPEIYPWLGVQPMKGILLHGPPGCGKTKLAHAIANEAGVPFYKISATEVVSGVSGESEENIRNLFSKALKTAPAIIFIDEIDAISAKRENLQREMERRIVVQLLTCMDESHETMISADQESDAETPKKKSGHVLVIGATNRPDALDPALRRPGRFDREIVLGVPDENSRVEILSVITRGLRLEGSFDFKKIAKCTPGFVGADLTALTREAASVAIKRIIASRNPQNLVKCGDIEVTEYAWWKKAWTQDEMNNLSITMADFEEAATKVQPSTRREGFSAIPNVKWDDVGALSSLRKDFEMYVVRRIKHPEEYEALGMDLDNGFLLYGPPGCGKTLVAKAVANEAGSNFIHIKGPELLNKYVGESELAIRTIFTRARTCSPCILFFDEIDALTTKRGKDGGWVVERLLNQLLIEMDGSEKRKGVFVIGATNRPEVMDPAVLRPGRFGKLLYVPIPDAEGRVSILKTLTRKRPLSAEVDLNYIGHSQSCENFSGADLAALVNEACMCALQEKIAAAVEADSDVRKYALVVNLSHFEQAFKRVVPSVSKVQRHYYEQVFQKFMGLTGKQ
ncbi:cell division control protein 48 homolog C-like [Cryptomeria japonica]|uniref:cell division control protein 48 homolog C-like n=1 Tax=Cryptomeria japonica TaxID=3369 RepID=UPI0027DA402D|nr:cell division control protein 48 homolog C-like [Cryptomeria japonica]XP_059069086.1 cell division control protein 48 homolog C-like [Cryptomeria japonica]